MLKDAMEQCSPTLIGVSQILESFTSTESLKPKPTAVQHRSQLFLPARHRFAFPAWLTAAHP
jgi:hypothetical protein